MAAPAGWYVDPQNPQLMRYFDGQSWTTQTQPVPVAATPQSPTTSNQQGPSLSYQHPGRQNAAQQPAQSGGVQPGQQPGQQPGFQPGGFGQAAQQPGVGQGGFGQPGYGQAGHQGQAGQPGQAGFGQPGFGQPGYAQPGYAQPGQPLPSEDRPTGTPRGVKFAIAGAAVGVLALTGIGMALSSDGEAVDETVDGLSAYDLGLPDDFDCQALADQAIILSEVDPVETQLITATGLSESKNAIGHVLVPDEGKNALVMECSGEGTWGDGSDTKLKLRLTLDSLGELYVEYGDR